jgi:hypothetical protein
MADETHMIYAPYLYKFLAPTDLLKTLLHKAIIGRCARTYLKDPTKYKVTQ